MNYKVQTDFDPKIFGDKKISLQAKGLYMVILNRIDKYIDYRKLHKLSSNNRIETQRAIVELVQNGYLIRKRIRNDSGVSSDWVYKVYINETHTL